MSHLYIQLIRGTLPEKVVVLNILAVPYSELSLCMVNDIHHESMTKALIVSFIILSKFPS